MQKFETCTEYWLDPNSLEFRGLFDEMYCDIDDPWGCEKGKNSLNNRVFLEILSEFAPYGRIIDIGSGLGGFCAQLKSRFPNSDVAGCEVAHHAVKKARAKYTEVIFHQMDIIKDPVIVLKNRGGAELVTLCEVLWYLLDDLDGVFRKITDVLNSGGILGIHQYFPSRQRFGVDIVNGLRGFEEFIQKRTRFEQKAQLTATCPDGLVLLATYTLGEK